MTAASYRPQIDLAAILAAQNPQIDLRLDDYERSTRSFMNVVANYTKKTTTSVVEKTDTYNTEKARLAEKIQTTKAEINQCKEAEIELVEGKVPSGWVFVSRNPECRVPQSWGRSRKSERRWSLL